MEQYVKQPAEVEVFDLGGQTDIILRRDIQQAEQPLEDGGAQTIWTCEERQHRVPGSYTAEDVQADFDAWWDYDPTVPEEPDDPETRIMAAFADAIRGGVNGVSATRRTPAPTGSCKSWKSASRRCTRRPGTMWPTRSRCISSAFRLGMQP